MKVGKYIIGGILFICIFIAVPLSKAGLIIVKNGKPHAVIVIPKSPSYISSRAAYELQEYVKKIAGVTLPIYTEDEIALKGDLFWFDRYVPLILVGPCKMTKQFGIDIDKLPYEGFYIKTKNNRLILAGRDITKGNMPRQAKWQDWRIQHHSRGTLWAVYTFLEDYLGVRWLWPGDLGEVIVKRKDIVIKELNRMDKPAFPIRHFYTTGCAGGYLYGYWRVGLSKDAYRKMWTEVDDWLEHQKFGGSLEFWPCPLFDDRFVEKYADKHPEWFALQPNGKRANHPTFKNRPRMCLSNDELLKVVVKTINDDFDKYPDKWGVMLCLADVSPEKFCCCEKCKKLGKSISEREFAFFSKVAREVAKTHPDRAILAMTYYTMFPSPHLGKLPQNLIPAFLSGGRDPAVGIDIALNGYLVDRNRRIRLKAERAWRKIANKMFWRGDYSHGLGFPINYLTKLCKDYKEGAATGKYIGGSPEGIYNNWVGEGLAFYATGKIFWNPNITANEILNDYCEKGFRKSAIPVKKFYKTLEVVTDKIAKINPSWEWRTGFIPTAEKVYPLYLDKLYGYLSQADKLAADDIRVRQRIQFLRTSLDYAKIQLEVYRYAAAGQKEKLKEAMQRRYRFFKSINNSFAVSVGWVVSKEGNYLTKLSGWNYPK